MYFNELDILSWWACQSDWKVVAEDARIWVANTYAINIVAFL
jgi:hypothetical protein